MLEFRRIFLLPQKLSKVILGVTTYAYELIYTPAVHKK